MRYMNWLLRAAVFIMLLSFVVKNDQPVVLSYFFGYEWQASLVVVLVLFFVAGIGVGMLSALNEIFWQQRKISRLRGESSQKTFSPR